MCKSWLESLLHQGIFFVPVLWGGARRSKRSFTGPAASLVQLVPKIIQRAHQYCAGRPASQGSAPFLCPVHGQQCVCSRDGRCAEYHALPRIIVVSRQIKRAALPATSKEYQMSDLILITTNAVAEKIGAMLSH